MLFNSPIFLFLFLPITLLIYYIIPNKFKNLILLFFSLIFYTWGEKELVGIILLSSIIDFSAGLIIDRGKHKLGLILSIIFNLGILVYFKYSNFIFTNVIELLEAFNVSNVDATRFSKVVLPLGISFYTFQTMSYTIDVYRGHIKATKNFTDFATYVTLFPQLIAGPIVRYKEIAQELISRKTSFGLFSEGVERFIIGLAKKMIIANNCAFLADGIFNMPGNETSASMAWLGALAYGFQIYFDFSGYSDMAIGLGKMFGFNFPENFNYPYISKSIREFWRRWHITLSQWFKDYLYISLGGNRKGNLRTYFNLFIVFFITGLWHGANWTFIVWGLIHGFFLITERMGFGRLLGRLPKLISHLYVILVVSISWVFFKSESIGQAFSYVKSMFSFGIKTNTAYLNFYLTKEVILVMILAFVLSTPVYKKLNDYVERFKNNSKKHQLLTSFKTLGLMFLLIISYVYIATDSYNPFIYFRF